MYAYLAHEPKTDLLPCPTIAATYREVRRYLNGHGYTFHQKSDYMQHDMSAVATWLIMVGMVGEVNPPGKLATTLKGTIT